MTKPVSDPMFAARDPRWLAHRYDAERDAFQFREVPRDLHRSVPFITDEHLPQTPKIVALPRAQAITAAPAPGPVHFVFHSAFCCSTLLARAFDIEGISMGLKEPVILNDMSGWHGRGAEPKRLLEALDHALRMLGRSFSPGEAVVIKPSNVTNTLAPAMMALRPEAGALLLHAPLRTFLGSVARKGMWGRLWVRELLVKLARGGIVDLGFTNEDYLRHTDLQVAAVGWLAQHALFYRMVRQFGPNRVKTIDSETLLARREAVMTALAALYRLPLSPDLVAGIVSGPAFSEHSKLRTDFGLEDRANEAEAGLSVHADEIEKVLIWAASVAASADVPMELPAPLLG